MNAQLHIDGSFQAMRQALDEANREFASSRADRHRDAGATRPSHDEFDCRDNRDRWR
jgi:hypothetical protein